MAVVNKEFVLKYKDYVNYLAETWYTKYHHAIDDIKQDFLTKLCLISGRYDEQKASEKLYIITCLKREMHLSLCQRYRHNAEIKAEETICCEYADIDSGISVLDEIIEDDEINNLYTRIREYSSTLKDGKNKKKVLNLFLEGKNQKEIAEK